MSTVRSIAGEWAKVLLVVVMIALAFYVTSAWLGLSLRVVKGSSMVPTLQEGDLVIVMRVDPGEIEVDDIIVYTVGGEEVIHRVIGKEGDIVFTKGDNNPLPDKPVHVSAVLGEVIFRIPMLGYVRLYTVLGIPIGIWLAIVTLIAIAIADLLRVLRAALRD